MTGKHLIQGELRPELFNELLNGPLSTRIGYQRAQLCPCHADASMGDPDPTCPVCTGKGYTWHEVVPEMAREVTLTRQPVEGCEDQEQLPGAAAVLRIVDEHGQEWPADAVQVYPDGRVEWLSAGPERYTRYTVTIAAADLRAGVQGVMSRREYQVRGEFDVLDLSMTLDRYLSDGSTLNPAWDCGDFDRFALLDAWRRHTQKVKRGNAAKGGDVLLYRSVRDIRVRSIFKEQIKEWVLGEDYTVVDGRIVWAANRGPAPGAVYAIEAQVNPEYYVYKTLPQLRHQDGYPLPRRIVLKGFENFPDTRRPSAPITRVR